MAIKVTVLKPHRYAGKRRNVGEQYEFARRSDESLFRALGLVGTPAVLPPHVPAPVAAPASVRTDPVVEPFAPFVHEWANVAAVDEVAPACEESHAQTDEQSEAKQPKPKRQNRRRDQAAEE